MSRQLVGELAYGVVVGVGMLACASLVVVLLCAAALVARDKLCELRQARARKRFTREALRAARARQAEQERARAARELEFKQDWDRAWQMLTSAPELRGPERSS